MLVIFSNSVPVVVKVVTQCNDIVVLVVVCCVVSVVARFGCTCDIIVVIFEKRVLLLLCLLLSVLLVNWYIGLCVSTVACTECCRQSPVRGAATVTCKGGCHSHL